MDGNIESVNPQIKVQTNAQDIINQIACYWDDNKKVQNLIQVVLEFESHLSIELIKKAVRYTIDEEAVLGCYFVEHNRSPYWKRFENIEDFEWCIVQKCDNTDEAIRKFLLEPLEPEIRQLQTKIIQSRMKDFICVKISHTCCDVGGAKEYIRLLSSIYSSLCEKTYFPKIVNKSRDTRRIFKGLGIKNYKTIINPQISSLKPTWTFPYKHEKPEKINIAIRRLQFKEYTAIYNYAKYHNVTINDVILTAYYRAMFTMVNTTFYEPMEIYVTVDLRRYLPGNEFGAVTNLLGIVNVRIDRKENESFLETMKRVSKAMKQIKKASPGLHSAATTELIVTTGYKRALNLVLNSRRKEVENNKSSPILSNLGEVASYPFKFSDTWVTDAFITTPAMHSAGFLLGVSTYNKIMTFSVSYYQPGTKSEDVERLFDLVQNEMTLCTEVI